MTHQFHQFRQVAERPSFSLQRKLPASGIKTINSIKCRLGPGFQSKRAELMELMELMGLILVAGIFWSKRTELMELMVLIPVAGFFWSKRAELMELMGLIPVAGIFWSKRAELMESEAP